MRVLVRLRWISAVVAAAATVSCVAAGVASAEVVPPATAPPLFLPQSEFGRVIGDSLTCQINYRFWVENDAAAPRHTRINIQALGIDTLPWGTPDSCNQWVTLRWNVAAADRLGSQKGGEQQIYLQAGPAPTTPVIVDADMSDVASTAPLALIVAAMSRPAGYIPFANWGPESSISTVYAIP